MYKITFEYSSPKLGLHDNLDVYTEKNVGEVEKEAKAIIEKHTGKKGYYEITILRTEKLNGVVY